MAKRKRCGKRTYSAGEASAALAAMRGLGQRAEARSYYCPRCKGWHLTRASKPPGARKRRRW